MATNVNNDLDHQDIISLDVMDKQIKMNDLFQCFTAFLCTSCSRVDMSKRSAEYLIMLDKMTYQLYNLIWIMRDFFADWPLHCDCMVKLHEAIDNIFIMTQCLFQFSANAYIIDDKVEEEAIKLYEAIHKDSYKYHKMFTKIMSECTQCHPFLEHYYYQLKNCVLCRYIQNTADSASDSSSNDGE